MNTGKINIFIVTVILTLTFLVNVSAMAIKGYVGLNSYAMEVVLNKPGISVDEDKLNKVLEGLGAVVRNSDLEGFARKTWLLRWPIGGSDWVYIEVKFERLNCREEGEEYLAIRVQDKILVNYTERGYSYWSRRFNETIDVWKAIEVLEDLGYTGPQGDVLHPVCKGTENVKACYLYAERNIDGYVLELRITTTTSSSGNTTQVTFRVMDVLEVPSSIIKVAEKTIEKMMNKTVSIEFKVKKYRVTEVRAVHNQNILKHVLREFITYLNGSKAIVIDNTTLNEIIECIKLGYAGWNERLIYSKEKKGWYRYSKVFTEFNGCLVKRIRGMGVDELEKLLSELDKIPLAKIGELTTTTTPSLTTGKEEVLEQDNVKAAVIAVTIAIIVGITTWTMVKRL